MHRHKTVIRIKTTDFPKLRKIINGLILVAVGYI